MYSILYSFLDMICFTFPEFIFITSMVYIFLKRYDLIDFYRPLLTVKNICIPALCSAFVLNISEILAIKLIGQISSILILCILTYLVINKNSYQKTVRLFLKTIVSVMAGLFISMIIETSCVIILITVLKINVNEMLSNITDYAAKVATSLGWIITELIIIILLYIKRNNKFIELIHTILKNKQLLLISVSILGINAIVIFITLRLVLFQNIFYLISITEQIIILLGIVIVIPMLALLLIVITVITLIKKEAQIQQLYQDTDLNN